MRRPRPRHDSRSERRYPGIPSPNVPEVVGPGQTARTPAQESALLAAISTDRLGTYRTRAAQLGCDVLDLYVWDRDLAVAVLADVAIVEVALRNVLHAALTTHTGTEQWYLVDIGLDDRSRRELAEAWKRLSKDQRTPGRVVARLMFGFWVGLLDAGGYVGQEPQAFRADYEQLFRTTLSRAFPGGRVEARRVGASFTREWVHETVTVVHALRNRAAHHEPLVDGFPLHGQRDRHGNVVRLIVADGHAATVRLAAAIDRDLAAWLSGNSTVPRLLAAPPGP